MSVPKVIVALDYNSEKEALEFAARVNPSLCALKVGNELFTTAGVALVEKLVKLDFKIFLDLIDFETASDEKSKKILTRGSTPHRLSSAFLLPCCIKLFSYSLARASIGLSLAADLAGMYPKITPIADEVITAITMDARENDIGIEGMKIERA